MPPNLPAATTAIIRATPRPASVVHHRRDRARAALPSSGQVRTLTPQINGERGCDVTMVGGSLGARKRGRRRLLPAAVAAAVLVALPLTASATTTATRAGNTITITGDDGPNVISVDNVGD